MSIAVLLDSAATTGIQVVWGYGRIRVASQITFLSAGIGVVGALSLVPIFGASGAAAGMAIGVAFSSVLFILSAARASTVGVLQIFKPALRSIFLPAIVEMAFLLSCLSFYHRTSWIFIVACTSSALALYAILFYLWSAGPVEKKIVAGVVVSTSRNLYKVYTALRRALERFPPLRIAILYVVEIKNTLVDSSHRDRKAVERLYSGKEDPFGFNRDLEQFRFERAIDYVRSAANGSHFPRALEIGCAEGMFTRLLAPWCESLMAVDLSPIALERAERNCADLTNVHFAEWDVREDSLEGPFDLIVATGVLEYILRPSTLRSAKERITGGLRSGGYLLLGNTATTHHIEEMWIGRKLIRGTLVNDLFANDPRYELIDSSLDQCVCPFAHVLLRRR
jgi:SAM-dependent methyltransferase